MKKTYKMTREILLVKFIDYLEKNYCPKRQDGVQSKFLHAMKLNDAYDEEGVFYDDEEIDGKDSEDDRYEKQKKKKSEYGFFSLYLKKRFQKEGIAKKLNLYMFERDITTKMIYERCYVDRRLISKITGTTNYHPSKNTMLALCIGLRLNLPESIEFLDLAGYSFSNTSVYDLIFKFFIENEIYDIDKINSLLYEYHEPCLGE